MELDSENTDLSVVKALCEDGGIRLAGADWDAVANSIKENHAGHVQADKNNDADSAISLWENMQIQSKALLLVNAVKANALLAELDIKPEAIGES